MCREIDEEEPESLDRIDWSLIDEKKAIFILDQAEKAMTHAKENNNILDGKIAHLSVVYMTIFSIMTAVIPFINRDKADISALIVCLGMILGLATLFLSYRTKEVPIIGTSPSELLKKKYNSLGFDYLVKCQLQTYINRLEELKQINKKTGQAVNYSIYIVLGALFISLLYRALPVLAVAVAKLVSVVIHSCCVF